MKRGDESHLFFLFNFLRHKVVQMIIYLHGFNATSPSNHKKILQLKFIDEDIRFVHYSTVHPKYDMSLILKEVHQHIKNSDDPSPLICGVGLGAFWSERVGFLCGIKQVLFNPNLYPEENMDGRIDWPEEYQDIKTKCVSDFREKNRDSCLCILLHSADKNAINSYQKQFDLSKYYKVMVDEHQQTVFNDISIFLQDIKKFKEGTDK